MIDASLVAQAIRERGFGLATGVPCSALQPLVNCLPYLPAANEGEAVAIAAGAELGGLPAVAMFQNSGLGNAVNPLTSLSHPFRVPCLLIVSWRGGPDDEPQHELMGRLTPGLLDLMELPWELFPATPEAVGPALERAVLSMRQSGLPYVWLVPRGALAPHPQAPPPQARAPGPPPESADERRPTRVEALRTVLAATRRDDAVIATTGFMGRCLHDLEDRPSHLYMVGSMGCASSLGLGLALARPERRVIVLDGDGAALMRLGALPTLGWARPANLVHLVLDNECHASTGGQEAVSHSTDLAAVAQASGYPRVVRGGLEAVLEGNTDRLTFGHVKLAPGEPPLGRPSLGPAENARRFRDWLGPRGSAGGRSAVAATSPAP